MEKQDVLEQVRMALERIRPYLQADGGDISIVELTDDMVVKVKLQGACRSEERRVGKECRSLWWPDH